MSKYAGSRLDDFLQEEGILAEAEALAVKRTIAYQIEHLMVEKNLSKKEMAKRMGTSRSALERLLDPDNPSVTLLTLERAVKALGKRITAELTA